MGWKRKASGDKETFHWTCALQHDTLSFERTWMFFIHLNNSWTTRQDLVSPSLTLNAFGTEKHKPLYKAKETCQPALQGIVLLVHLIFWLYVCLCVCARAHWCVLSLVCVCVHACARVCVCVCMHVEGVGVVPVQSIQLRPQHTFSFTSLPRNFSLGVLQGGSWPGNGRFL